MAVTDWIQATRLILQAAAPSPTARQLQLAKMAEIALSQDLPALVAGARLRIALRNELCLAPSGEPTEAQHAYLQSLASQAERTVSPPDSIEEYEAWNTFLRLTIRAKVLNTLKLAAGDVVRRGDSEPVREVSSIGVDGTIYFRGGSIRAWPDELQIACRADDSSPDALHLKQEARNEAARQKLSSSWSKAKEASLSQYRIVKRATLDDIAELRRVVNSAEDEKPVQEFLEQCPQLLALLLGGRTPFCISRPQLGKDFIPDFLVADVDSRGIRWVGFELETPNSEITLKTSNQFSKHPRDGIAQIREWREWLLRNSDQATRPLAEYGLGLHGIRPDLDGIVVVGRRHRLTERAPALRHQLWEKERIYLHTYDGLLERMENAAQFNGPPGYNQWLFKPAESSTEGDHFNESNAT